MADVENKVVTEEVVSEPVETKKKKPQKKPVVSNKAIRIEAWQNAASLDGYVFGEGKVDGEWNAACEAIAKVALVKCRSIYMNRNLTIIVQNAVGVSPDGMCGPETKEAIRKYQKANKLFPDGIVDLATWKKILKV